MIGYDEATNRIAHILNTTLVFTDKRDEVLEGIDITIKSGQYTKDEVADIDRYLNQYMQDNGHSLSELQEFIVNDDKKFPFRECIEYIACRLKYRHLLSVYLFMIYKYHPSYDERWNTKNEIELMDLIKVYKYKWKMISKEINMVDRCIRSKYMRLLNEKVNIAKVKKLCEKYACEVSEDDIAAISVWTTNNVYDNVNRIVSRKVNANWSSESNFVLCSYAFYLNCYTDDRYKIFITDKISLEEVLKCEEENRMMSKIDSAHYNNLTDDCCVSEAIFEIKVELCDIFWDNIRMKMGMPCKLIQAKFKTILKVYGIINYGDLLVHILSMKTQISEITRRSKLVNEL